MDEAKDTAPRDEVRFLRRVLIAFAILVLALLLWQVRQALLLVFGGVVFAVLLLALAHPIERRLGLSRGLSFAVVGVGLAMALGAAMMLVGTEVAAQIGQFREQLPKAVAAAEDRFGISIPFLGEMVEGGGAPDADPATLGTLAGHAATAGGLVLNAASALVLVLVGGVFLASDPALYQRGLGLLLPRGQQARTQAALENSGHALRLWLLAQLASMAIVGVAAGLGAWVIGLPSPLALGLFAGLAGFVPLIGAVAGALPALLLALAEGGRAVLWTALLFVAIQQIESNMIAPLLQKNMMAMPPALMLFAVVAVGLLFGIPGILLAAPLTVVAFVLTKQLYVRDTLGHRTDIPGEAG